MDLFGILLIIAHLLIFVVFVNRYIFGRFYLNLNKKALSEIKENFHPPITIIVPLYNEGGSIAKTIRSFSEQVYPKENLHVMVIDDCSTDNSYEIAKKEIVKYPNAQIFRNKNNVGKRKSIINAVRRCKTEFVISIDSDVILDKHAISRLIRRFTKEDIVAVGGRVDVVNNNVNWLTQMQTVKYYYSYKHLKNLERSFFSVMCLSGCLTAYRTKVLIELEDILLKRNFFGLPIKYGEDRFLTRQIIKAGYKTFLTLDAHSYTKVPENLDQYILQQLRWRRSNLIDFFCGLSHIWKINPIVSIHYLGLFAMLLSYPMILIQTSMSGYFFEFAMFHILLLFIFVIIYTIDTRNLPINKKAKFPLAFLTIAIIMPVTYLILTPLALFTLDSGSWETR